MTRDKIANAVEADWSFTEDPAIMTALRKQADKMAAKCDYEADDILTEMWLYLSVRPEKQHLIPRLIATHAGKYASRWIGKQQSEVPVGDWELYMEGREQC